MTKETVTVGHSGGHAPLPRLRLLWGLAAAVLLAVTVAACGGGGSSGGSSTAPVASAASTAQTCTPNGTALQISAKSLAFDTKCLAVPADTPFTITFKNDDPGIPHNVAIFTNPAATTPLFVGDTITGPATTTYHVPALKPGAYFFRCDVHPTTMTGTFIVK